MASVASAENAAPPLVVESVVKRFRDLTAVAGLSLELKPGECLGLLGPNGAGKSTLIRAIAGRIRPDEGCIRVFGEPAGSEIARSSLGWIPQELALYPRLSCRENLQAFGRCHGLQNDELDAAIDRCLKWAMLEDRAKEIARNLSGGMKRRLNMAVGLLHQPRIVLMDEPTVGVDPQSRNHIYQMIEQLIDQGTAILYTSHYMEEAERLCQRIAILDHGSVIALGTHQELVHSIFANHTQVSIRFVSDEGQAREWTETHSGKWLEAGAEFTLKHPAAVATVLESATSAGLEVEDLTLRRPNLESVFLPLTGRELRD